MQLPNGPNVPFPGGLQRIHPATGGTQATGVPVINFNDFISLIRQGTVTHSGSGPFGAGRDLTYVNLGSLIPNAPEVAIPSNSLPQYLRGNSGTAVSHESTHIVRGRQSVGQAQIPSLSQTPSLGSLSSALSNINRTPGVPLHPIAALHQAHALSRRVIPQPGARQHPAAIFGNQFGGMPTNFNSFPGSIHPVAARLAQQHNANAIRQSLSGSRPLTGPLHPAILRSLSNSAPSLPRVPFHPASILNAVAPQAMGSNARLPALNRLHRFNDGRVHSSSTTSFVHHQSRFAQVPNLVSGINPVSSGIFPSSRGSSTRSGSGGNIQPIPRQRNGQRTPVSFGPASNIPLTANRRILPRTPGPEGRNRVSPNPNIDPRLSVNRIHNFVRRSSFDDFVPRSSSVNGDRQIFEDQPQESRFVESRRSPVSRGGFSDPNFRRPSTRFNQINLPTDQFNRRENLPFDSRRDFTRDRNPQPLSNIDLPSTVDERIQQDFMRDNFALPRQFDPDFSRPFDSGNLGSDSINVNPRFTDRRPENMQPLRRGTAPRFIPARFPQPLTEDQDSTTFRRSRGRPLTNTDIPSQVFQPSFISDRRSQAPRSREPANDFPRPIGIAIPPNQVTRDRIDSNVDTFRRGIPFSSPSFDNRRLFDDRNSRFSPENRFVTPRVSSRPNVFTSRRPQSPVIDDRRFRTPTRATSPSSPRPIGIAVPRQRIVEPFNTGLFERNVPFNGRDLNDVRENRIADPQNFGFGPENRFLPPNDLSSPPFIPSRVLQPPFNEDPRFQNRVSNAPFMGNRINDVPRPIGIAVPSNRATVQPMFSTRPGVGQFPRFNDQDFDDLRVEQDNRFGDRRDSISSPFSRFDPLNRLNTRFDDPRDGRFEFNNIFDRDIDRFDSRAGAFDPDRRFDDRGPFDDRRPFDDRTPFDDRRSDDPFGDIVDFFDEENDRSFTPFFQPRFPPLVRSSSGSQFSVSPVSREMTRFFQRSPVRRPRGSFLISFLVNIDDVTSASDEVGFDVNRGVPRGFQNRFIPRDSSSPFRVNGPMGEDINRLEERDIFENDQRNARNNFGNPLPRVPSGRFPGRNDGINERAERPFNPRDMMPRTPFAPPMAPSPPQVPVNSFQTRPLSQFRRPIDTNRPFFRRSQPMPEQPVRQTRPPPQPFGLAIPDPDGPRNQPFLTAAVQGQFDGPMPNIDINDAFNRRQPGLTSEPVVPFPQGGFEFNQPRLGSSQISSRNNIPNVRHLLNLGNSIVHSQTAPNIPASSGAVGGIQRPINPPVNTVRGGPLSAIFNLRRNSNVLQNNNSFLGVQGQGNPGIRSVFRQHRHVTHTVGTGGPSPINSRNLYVSKKAFGRYE